MLNLSEHNILLFLLQMFLLLISAKVLGEIFATMGLPRLVGELLTGVIFGATVLGRISPDIYTSLFPESAVQQSVLDAVGVFGVLFLLLTTGFEVNISSLWKRGRASFQIGIASVSIPIVLGFAAFYLLPKDYVINSSHITFTAFLAVVSAVGAIPTIAKILHEMEIIKSDFGITTLLSYTVKDLAAWMIFAIFLGYTEASSAAAGETEVLKLIFEVVLFVAVTIALGYKVVDAIIIKLRENSLDNPATVLVVISLIGLFCGIITQWLGIHALFGFFLAGIMVGNASEIPERTRSVISQMVYAIFVPIFFSTIAIRIDFVGSMDILLILVITSVSMVSKFLGGYLGAKWAKIPKADELSIGAAHIPGGAMMIIVAGVAFQSHIIPESVFVAVVFAALLSTIFVGPLLKFTLSRRKSVDVLSYFRKDMFIGELSAKSPREAIIEMCSHASAKTGMTGDDLTAAVLDRESTLATGIGRGVAVPHARLTKLNNPIVAFAVSKSGIDWECRDGAPVRFVFLILTPQDEDDIQVQILSTIARMVNNDNFASALNSCSSADEYFSHFRKLQAELERQFSVEATR